MLQHPLQQGGGFFGGGKGATAKLPKSYDEIHAQAIASIEASLAGGYRAVEVEFPAIASVNKQSDGSASSQAMVRKANVVFVAKVAAALSAGGRCERVFLLAGDRATLQELSRAGLPQSTVLGVLQDGAPSAGARDVILVATPAETRQWAGALLLSRQSPVVVLNGACNNGYKGFEMAYYLKPMTFNSQVNGYVTRQLPGAWMVLSGTDGSRVAMDVTFVQTPDSFRPDLQAISRALSM